MSRRVSAYLRQNVLGLVAIFLALSAGAYAVQKAPKNSVVSKSIKNGQVRNDDLGAAAVTGEKVAQGAIGAGALGPGAVTADKLGFDPATQGELDATASALTALSAPGAINTADNPVDWTKLKGVPDGLADGIDRLFGLAATDTSSDTTPSVANLSVLTFNVVAPKTVTDLVDGIAGQILTLHVSQASAGVDITDTGQFVLSGPWVPDAGDTLTLARVGAGFWVEVERSNN